MEDRNGDSKRSVLVRLCGLVFVSSISERTHSVIAEHILNMSLDR